TSEPSQEPTQEPTSEPTQEPTSEPSQEPTCEPTQEPTSEPSQEPSASPEPSATPRPLPGSISGLVNITPEGTARQENGVWHIQLSAPDGPVSFTWSVSGEAVSYLLYAQSGQGEMRFLTETQNMRIDLPSANYAQGQHTLYVGAVLADDSVTWGSITFELASQQADRPAGRFPGGSRPSGGQPSGSASMGGEAAQEEQGFRITPGKALTSKHSSGTKNMNAYTHSEIPASGEAITALVLSSTQSQITLDNGAAFHVFREDAGLQLVPESEGEAWQLNALAMNTLAGNGIECVVFHVGEASYTMSTEMEFSGSVYASLRAEGYVSKDMEIIIDGQGMYVHIAGGVYRIGSNGELVPCEE
ncbi:MAG: procyclic acidic repetitive family protein, partial [Clostridia bacterium]|nr:procyclic acidic repetitive family protein [Clostridia bacterium]